MKILKLSDRISVKQDGIELIISPLSLEQKMEISGLNKIEGGESKVDRIGIALKTIKFSLKNVFGLTNHDETKYEPTFDSNGFLSDESVEEIFTALGNEPIFQSLSTIVGGELKVDGAEVSVFTKKKEDQRKVESPIVNGEECPKPQF